MALAESLLHSCSGPRVVLTPLLPRTTRTGLPFCRFMHVDAAILVLVFLYFLKHHSSLSCRFRSPAKFDLFLVPYCRLQKLDQQKLHKEALMTEKEVPSWLKYEEEKQVSAGQVRFVFTRSGAHLCCSHNHALARLVFSERRPAQ